MSPDQREAAIRRLSAMGIAAFRRIADLEQQLESARRTAEWIVSEADLEPPSPAPTGEYHPGHPGAYVAGTTSDRPPYTPGPAEWGLDGWDPRR